jgi:tetratricopeptide (TPR) repeat protein
MIELSLSIKQTGNIPEARRLLELSLSINPNSHLAHNNYAFMLWDSYQEYDLALEHINKALKIKPKHATYWHTFAEVLWYGFKNKEKALEALYKAKEVDKSYKAGDKMIEELESAEL